MHNEELENIKKEFLRIKKMGYICNTKKISNGIGNFFNSNINTKLLKNVDIKSKGNYTRVYKKLFLAPPDGDSEYIKRLYKNYSYQDQIDKRYRILGCFIQANCSTFIGARFLFRLKIKYDEEKVFLTICDRNFTIIEEKVYWTFDSLKNNLKNNFPTLVLIKAWSKTIKGLEYYKYYDIEFLELKSFSSFLKLLEDGTIRISLKIGTFRKGSKKGQINNFGTYFEIQELDYEKLYTKLKL